MSLPRSALSRSPSSQTHPLTIVRRVLGSLRPLFKCLLIVALFGLFGGLSEIGFTQRKPTLTQTPKQSNAAKQISSSRKKASEVAAQSSAVVPQPSAKPAWPSKFRVTADKPSVYQGELVTFTLDPAPPSQFPFKFAFDFRDDNAVAAKYSAGAPISHRFLTTGAHEVSAQVIAQEAAPATLMLVLPPPPTIEKGPVINVDKTPLTIKAFRGETGPPFVVGQEISFSTYDLIDPSVRYRFYFDNQAGRAQAEPMFSRHYDAAGEHSVRVEVLFTSNDNNRRVSSDPQTITINPLPSDAVEFTLDPPSQEIAREIKFTAALKSARLVDLQLNSQELQYRFDYGDGKIRDWSKESTSFHPYAETGSYQPYVEVRLNDGRKQVLLVRSEPLKVTISTQRVTGSKIDIYYLLIGGAIVLVGSTLFLYLSYKLWRRPSSQPPSLIPNAAPPDHPQNSPPTLHPAIVLHSDRNPVKVEKPRVSIGLQVRFGSGIGTSQSSLTMAEPRLIRSERRLNV